MSEVTRAGWIGLGVMGAPMAARLAGGYPLRVYDRDDERMAALSAHEGVTAVASGGAAVAPVETADSVAAAAKGAEVVFLSLPTTAVVEAVIAGEGGLASVMAPGTVVVDMSTTEPETTRRLASVLAERGVAMVDAPVSGGQKGAEAGTLSIMCGGEAAVVERCRPLLELIGSSVVRVGEIGSGGVAKLVNNMIVGAAFTSIAEGLAIAASAGIAPRDLHAAIRGGWAGSPVLDVSIEAIAEGDFRPGGTVDLLSKDLGYARNLARSRHIPLPVTAIVDEVFTAAIARGDGGKAQPIIARMWESVCGLEIVPRSAGSNDAAGESGGASGTQGTAT